MAEKKPKLLPRLTYRPPQDQPEGGRGSGDYQYMTRGATYNANPEYAGQYGGDRPAENEPPKKNSGGLLGGSAREGYAYGDMPIDQFLQWVGGIPERMNDTFAAANQNPLFFRSQVSGQGNIGAGEPQPTPPPAWMTGSPTPQYNPQAQQQAQGDWRQGIYDWLNQAGQGAADWISGVNAGYNGTQNGLFGGGGGQPQAPNNPPPNAGATNAGGTGPTSGTGFMTGIQNWQDKVTSEAEQMARTQDAVSKNQRLTEQAKASGNDKELARLQAEWDRIAPKAAKYGITAERLVNSYMQPGNSAAESSLDRALGRAIADDTWAQAATVAFGRPPNQVEWDEHWRAMNKGGRDPLEGHPQAIQQIQARMQEIEQENQNEAFGKYQEWLAGQ